MKTPKREVLGVPVTANRNLLYYDNREGRRMMADALSRLDDRGRLSFVNWCCRKQGRFDRARAVPAAAGYYPVGDAMADMAQLSILGGGGGVDADVMLAELVRRARRA